MKVKEATQGIKITFVNFEHKNYLMTNYFAGHHTRYFYIKFYIRPSFTQINKKDIMDTLSSLDKIILINSFTLIYLKHFK